MDPLRAVAEALDAVRIRHAARLALAVEAQSTLEALEREAFRRREPKRSWWPWAEPVPAPSAEEELAEAMRLRMRCTHLRDRLAAAVEGLGVDRVSLTTALSASRRAGAEVQAALRVAHDDPESVVQRARWVEAVAEGVTSLEVHLPDAASTLEALHRAACAMADVLVEAEREVQLGAGRSGEAARLAEVAATVRSQVQRVVRPEGERGVLDSARVDALVHAFEPVPPVCEVALAAEVEVVASLRERSVDAVLEDARRRLTRSRGVRGQSPKT